MKKILFAIVAVAMCVAAHAQTYTEMAFGQEYPVAGFGTTYLQVTAPSAGKISLLGYSASPSIKDDGGNEIVATHNGVYGMGDAGYYFAATAGTTYFITYTWPFVDFNVKALFEGVGDFTLKLKDVLPAEGTRFTVGGDGQAYIRFNTNEVSFFEGTLACGPNKATVYSIERWNDLVEEGVLEYVQVGTSGVVPNEDDFVWGHYDHGFLLEFRTMVYRWIESGTVHDGDQLVLTLDGVQGEGQTYNGDGKLEVRWTLDADPLRLVSADVPSALDSWYNEGDAAGVATFTFSREVGSAMALLNMGNAEADDFWMDEQIADRVSIEGNVVRVDFSGVMRTYKSMGLTMEWGSYEFELLGVRDLDGNLCYSADQGGDGSFSYFLTYNDISQTVAYEIEPCTGSSIEEDGLTVEIWMRDDTFIHYDGVMLTWRAGGIEHSTLVPIADCQVTRKGTEATIAFVLPDGLKDAADIRVALNVTWSKDGNEHEVAAQYNTSGDADALTAVTRGGDAAACYTLAGQRTDGRQGIVIVNGHKVLRR